MSPLLLSKPSTSSRRTQMRSQAAQRTDRVRPQGPPHFPPHAVRSARNRRRHNTTQHARARQESAPPPTRAPHLRRGPDGVAEQVLRQNFSRRGRRVRGSVFTAGGRRRVSSEVRPPRIRRWGGWSLRGHREGVCRRSSGRRGLRRLDAHLRHPPSAHHLAPESHAKARVVETLRGHIRACIA